LKERSLVVIKPDAVLDEKKDEIKSFLISKGVAIIQEKNLWFMPEILKAFYLCPIPKASFEKMVELYAKSFAILIVFEGEDAIAVGQEAKNFFRRKYNYGYYGSTIHAADNAEEYTREVNLLNGSCGKF
jgi:nucleoside diphosphate kinase